MKTPSKKKTKPLDLYYWPGIQGRGEFIRLALEEAGVPYRDVAREKGGMKKMMAVLEGKRVSGLRPFAPPFVALDGRVLAQTSLVLHALAPRLGLAPKDEASRLAALQIQLTIADLAAESHDVHHPISGGLYYEDQKKEAKRAASSFTNERIPKFLGWLEDLLAANTASKGVSRYLVGRSLTYADLSAFQIVSGLQYAFPRTMKRLAKKLPLLLDLAERVAARPRIATYLASSRRLPWSTDDLLRHYPELDGA